MEKMRTTLLLGSFGALLLVATAGCKPEYPACDTDKDCKDKEFCVARKCQQCRNAGDCGEGRQCNAGRCDAIPGYCKDASQCAEGQICKSNRCQACAFDTQCPSGKLCMTGRCSVPQCTKDENCAQDQECVHGLCVGSQKQPVTKKPPCDLESVYFGFDKSNLDSTATSLLAKNASCLKKTDMNVSLTGRADPRGTTEYNMALSDRRAQSAKDYLKHTGIAASRMSVVPRGALDATGTSESGWAKDRRVDSEWR
jgi:peptidoglycan-associated lipoprotein